MNDRAVLFDCRLKEICKEKGIMLKDFAKEIGVSNRAMTFWCNGHGVELHNAMKIAEKLNMRVEDIWRLKCK